MAKVWIWRLIAAITPSIIAAMPFSPAIAEGSSPIYRIAIPDGYRHWELIAPSEETDSLNELRAILGNRVAIAAYGKAALPFPDGTILAKLAWKRSPSSEFEQALPPGAAATVQFTVKDSKTYAATGGWGFWPLYKRKAGRRGAAQDLLRLPLGQCERSRPSLHASRTIRPQGD